MKDKSTFGMDKTESSQLSKSSVKGEGGRGVVYIPDLNEYWFPRVLLFLCPKLSRTF